MEETRTEGQHFAIIVAGGQGSRMQSSLPKQFLEVGGKPLLMHTLEQFYLADPDVQLILVLPAEQRQLWNLLCQQYGYTRPVQVVNGGATRFQSVKQGLARVTGEGVVAVHDGVRPFVPVACIRQSFEVAREKGSAVLAVPLKDSIRELTSEGESIARDRHLFQVVQTPQTFQTGILKQAFLQPESSSFTDDASVVEKAGYGIVLIPGSYDNIKITTPEDLQFAAFYLQNRQ
jgi:2-C-methyl-D-erythritol 4-phosphate cytidylyltransferase